MSSTAGTENDPSPNRTGLVKALGRKSRRNKKQQDVSLNSSQNSTISIDDDKENDSHPHRSKLRDSIDAAIEKIKTGNRAESEERRKSEPKALQGLKGLLRSTKKRSRRASLAVEAEEVERGRSVAKRGTLEDPIESSNTSGAGGSSGNLKEAGQSDQEESSLITDDSETESPIADPPPLTTHPSHAGYLTLSSPSMRPAATVEETHVPPERADRPASRSNAASTSSSERTSGFTSTVARVATLPTLVGSSPSSSIDLTGGTKDTVTPADKLEASNSSPIGRSKSPSGAPGSSLSIDTNTGTDAGQSGNILPRKTDEERVRDREEVLASRRSARLGPTSPSTAAPTRDYAKPVASLSLRQADTAPLTPPFKPGTPRTTITPPTPTNFRADSPTNPSSPTGKLRKSGTVNVTPNAGQMLSHRRVQSASSTTPPGRFSHNISAPLTPTIEEPRSVASTPSVSGGNSGQGGFFSSVFSAAQNAASTLSNSIANTSLGTSNRSKSGTQIVDDNRAKQGKAEESSVSVSGTETGSRSGTADREQREQRPLAVETLGMGDLSLSHLGISVEAPPESAGPPSATGERTALGESPAKGVNGVRKSDDTERGHSVQRAEDGGGATVSSTVELVYDVSRPGTSVGPGEPTRRRRKADSISGESSGVAVVEDVVPGARPRSVNESVTEGLPNPSNATEGPVETGLKRGGSLRSRFDGTVRRKRGGSSVTGTTIVTAAGTNATATTLISPGRVPRVTGFAVASKKRNRDFHQLFKTVPEDDYLIEDYSAAIQKDILLHGRLYISERHICFNSNIFGYVTTLVISFDEVVSIEKKNTAMLFPNAIVIQTLHARNVFASLASRDSTYDLIVSIWKVSHPNIRSSANGVQLDETGSGDKTIKAEASSSDGQGDEDEEDEEAVYDEDAEEDECLGSFTEAGEGSMAGSDVGDATGKTSTRRAASTGQPKGKGPTTESQVNGDVKGDKGANGAPVSSADFPGPTTHRPTECGDQDKHFDKLVSDEVLPAPLGKVYSLMFGPVSGAFLATLLQDEQKVLDLQLDDDKMGLTDSKKTRTYSYIKPLNASIGPKQTKCIINETLEAFDLEKVVTVTVVTQTPDVPSGNVFNVKTKYCLTWAEGNGTRVLMTCTVEWTGKSWLKGPIEKGANEGQVIYAKDLMNALRSAISSKASASGTGVKGRIKRRKKEIAEISAQAGGKPAPDVKITYGSRSGQGPQHWGIFEPLRTPLSPVLDILTPLMTQNMALGFIVFLLLFSWLRPSRDPYWRAGPTPAFPGLPTPERLAAYEEIWRKEENGLWEWLDERVGVERLVSSRGSGQSVDTKKRIKFSNQAQSTSKLAQEEMSERQIEEAIRVTQERLDELKRIVKGRKRMEAGIE